MAIGGNKLIRVQKMILWAAVFLFVAGIGLGIISGITYAQSRATYQNALEVREALRYYRDDQDRYPSADQFRNQNILVPYYLDRLPSPVGASGTCAQYGAFVYSQASSRDFSLQFCLEQGVAGLSAGVHTFTEQGVR